MIKVHDPTNNWLVGNSDKYDRSVRKQRLYSGPAAAAAPGLIPVHTQHFVFAELIGCQTLLSQVVCARMSLWFVFLLLW